MKSKARSNHFAGQIINLDDNEVEISSLKHSEKYFWWLDPLNDSWADINDTFKVRHSKHGSTSASHI